MQLSVENDFFLIWLSFIDNFWQLKVTIDARVRVLKMARVTLS